MNRSHATREGNQTIRRLVRDGKVTQVTGRPRALGLEDFLPDWMWKQRVNRILFVLVVCTSCMY